VAWYEINTPEWGFNKEFAMPPRVGEELWLHEGEHQGHYVVRRVVHTELDKRDHRPSTRLLGVELIP
jgi:hypothetical protein